MQLDGDRSIPVANPTSFTNGSMEVSWHAPSRIASVRYTLGSSLTAADGVLLVDALTGWIGDAGLPFGVLADAAGLRGTDAEYRARASHFFRQHRDRASIALVNVGLAVQIVLELFRVGTGIRLKVLPSEADARAWLRSNGAAA